jgi:predicted GH43/DUF377 family glycosyl hydrolase
MVKQILGRSDLDAWDWAKSHACVPTALLFEDFIRIYFAPRNAAGQSIPVFVDVDRDCFSIIKYGHPIMELGETGTFDDGGIMPCSVVRANGRIYLYYVGWNPSVSVPYRNAIGLCVSDDDGVTFRRLYRGPVVDRSLEEPFFTASPHVFLDDRVWKMWYASCTGFAETDTGLSPLYHIKFATSDDGVYWERNNISCIAPSNDFECTARPCVIKENGAYQMWYCYRGSFDYRDGDDSYQIGFAESACGIEWERKDHDIKFNIGSTSHDNNMACYPSVIDINGSKVMFYNGNGFGKNGILCCVSD